MLDPAEHGSQQSEVGSGPLHAFLTGPGAGVSSFIRPMQTKPRCPTDMFSRSDDEFQPSGTPNHPSVTLSRATCDCLGEHGFLNGSLRSCSSHEGSGAGCDGGIHPLPITRTSLHVPTSIPTRIQSSLDIHQTSVRPASNLEDRAGTLTVQSTNPSRPGRMSPWHPGEWTPLAVTMPTAWNLVSKNSVKPANDRVRFADRTVCPPIWLRFPVRPDRQGCPKACARPGATPPDPHRAGT